MLRSELIRQIGLKHKNLGVKDIEDGVKLILQEMITALEENKKIEIRGFGTLSAKYQKPRTAINPKSQQFLQLPARYLAHFKMGNPLHLAINKLEKK